jgi:hypothetical protein
MQRFDENADHPAKHRPDGHGRDKDTARDLAAVRDDDEGCPHDDREKQRVDHTPLRRRSAASIPRGHLDPLAEPVVVSSALTLPKQNFHALGHVDPEKPVEIPDKRGDGRQGDRLGHTVIREMLSSERRHLKIKLDDEGAV